MKLKIKYTSSGISGTYALSIKINYGPPKSRETIPLKFKNIKKIPSICSLEQWTPQRRDLWTCLAVLR